MDRKGACQVTPKRLAMQPAAPFVENFTPGYMQRAVDGWPKQGSSSPWRVYQNYFRDVISLKWCPINNNSLEFSNPPKACSPPPPGEFDRMNEYS
jgi:monooxygenase